jgi:ketosteroid isomerase-like protein
MKERRSVNTSDFDTVVEHYQRAGREFAKGNPEPNKLVFSHREDVTLAAPLGPPVHGWEQVAATMERNASMIREGEVTGFDIVAKYVTPELAYMVWVERVKAKLGGRQEIVPFDLRVTTIFRPEDGTWKVVHRHADPITTAQPIESVIQK